MNSVVAESCVRDLRTFVKYAWDEVEPAVKLQWGKHLDVLCKRLMQVTNGEIQDLVICIPPGTGKSLIVSVLWQAWQWLHRPHEQTLHISNDPDLATRDSLRARDLVESTFYKSLIKHQSVRRGMALWYFRKDQNQKQYYQNVLKGFRQSKSINGRFTGKRVDGIVYDDPIDAKDVVLGSAAQVTTRMQAVRDKHDGVLSTRLKDRRTGYRVLVMQRLHDLDLAAHMASRGAVTLVLPMEYDAEIADPLDWRTEPGQLLFPDRFTKEVVETYKRELPGKHYASQFGQRPMPMEGSVFMKSWIQHYEFDRRKKKFDQIVGSVDATFKDKADSDFVCIQVWGKIGFNHYLLDCINKRMGYVETKDAIKRVCFDWNPDYILVEDKANGPALIDDLQREIKSIKPFEPGRASKTARAELAAVEWRAGNVYLPSVNSDTRWILGFIEQHLSFPGAPNDDMVDAASQYVLSQKDKKKVQNLSFMRSLI